MLSTWTNFMKVWQSYSAEECKNFPFISNGPHLPLGTILFLFIFCKIIIPAIIKKRGHPFDTRPIEIIFHGSFFGIFGSATIIGFYVFKGLLVFMSCKPIYIPTFLIPLRSHFAIMAIIVVHIYSLHFIFVALNGRKLNNVHLLYHSLSMFFATFGANIQPNENVCLYVVIELGFLALYSMLQVLNSASIEVKEKLVSLRTKIYLNYISLRQYQFTFLLVHGLMHLIADCSMKKEIALIQIFLVVVFKHFYKSELKTKLELPYCDDSILKEKKAC